MQMDKQWVYQKALEISYSGRIFLFTHSYTDACIWVGGGKVKVFTDPPSPKLILHTHTPQLLHLLIHHLLRSCVGFRNPQKKVP